MDDIERRRVEDGERRWLFNFEEWKPSEELWQHCLSLIPAEERDRIGRFKRPTKEGLIVGRHNANAKSSLVGRLLLRKCAREVLGLEELAWRRTAEGKPFLLNTPDTEQFGTRCSVKTGRVRAGYNMNLSHDGALVAFVGGADFVLGVDVMANTRAGSEPSAEFFDMFSDNFTAYEWSIIKSHAPSEPLLFESFFHHWTLKESYIKSIGIGLGFELQRAEFVLDDPNEPTNATVSIDKQKMADWHFEVHRNHHNHTVSVSYGPIEDCIASIQASLGHPGQKKEGLQDLDFAHKPRRVPFTDLSIEDLVGRK